MKRLIVVLAVLVAGLTFPASSYAETTNLEPGVCTTVYGGGTVCGAQAPHKPVETGLGENLALLGGVLILASGAIYAFSKKSRSFSI